jgi:hypothetical protein
MKEEKRGGKREPQSNERGRILSLDSKSKGCAFNTQIFVLFSPLQRERCIERFGWLGVTELVQRRERNHRRPSMCTLKRKLGSIIQARYEIGADGVANRVAKHDGAAAGLGL